MNSKDLPKLSTKQLVRTLQMVSDEIKRRERINDVEAELVKYIQNSGVVAGDLDLKSILFKAEKTRLSGTKKGKKKPTRTVEPKFKGLKNNETWTGRGLPPRWVKEICQNEGITVQEFKASKKFSSQKGQETKDQSTPND